MYMLRSELWGDCEERWDLVEGYLYGDPKVISWSNTIPEAAKDWSWPPNLVT